MERNEKGQFVQNREDVTGKKFNMLTALSFSHKDSHRKTYWDFQCDCGKIKTLRLDCVKNGSIKSCGCFKNQNLNREGSKPMYEDIGPLDSCNLYSRWKGMKRRCYDRNFSQYKDYGGRGITICDEWLYNFRTFYDWAMSHGYSPELQIDRIDNDGNYEPDNCRWVTPKENANNRHRVNTEINKEIA